jgi:hypothetical protein
MIRNVCNGGNTFKLDDDEEKVEQVRQYRGQRAQLYTFISRLVIGCVARIGYLVPFLSPFYCCHQLCVRR